MPGIVSQRKDGCWPFRIDYSTSHWPRWDYCPTPEGLDEGGRVGLPTLGLQGLRQRDHISVRLRGADDQGQPAAR